MEIDDFYNIHTGEIALLVGNGRNLSLTPPERFDYPAFGMNTIHKYEGWIPTYYTAVDNRVMREFGKVIAEKYRDVPKFIPRPSLDEWHGDNFYRFFHRPGDLIHYGRSMDKRLLSSDGISYRNVMHVAIQIAAWMGCKTLLMIGVHHKPDEAKAHFWGVDDGMPGDPPVKDWFDGYKELNDYMTSRGVRLLNISEDTHLPEEIIPRDDWRKWSNA